LNPRTKKVHNNNQLNKDEQYQFEDFDNNIVKLNPNSSKLN